MAPKPKVSPDKVINTYYAMMRKREANGQPMKGLNTEVSDFLGDITPQRVGQVIKKYEAELARKVGQAPAMPKPETKASPKVSKLSQPTEPVSEPRKSCRTDSVPLTKEEYTKVKEATEGWSEKSREARRKLAEAVDAHQEEELLPEENEPSRGGESWLSRLNDAEGIKALQVVNRNLELRIRALEAQLAAGLEGAPRRLRGSPKSSPRQEQILDLLSDGKERSFRHLERELKCSGAAVRNAVKKLKEKGQVKVRKVKGKGRVQLDRSVADLL